MGFASEKGSQITVKKADLLKKVYANSRRHEETFKKAMAGYRREVVKRLRIMLRDAVNGKDVKHTIELYRPVSHSKDYQRVIAMLEMEVSHQVILNEDQFRQYVQDEWGWSQDFLSNSTQYLGKTKR